MLRLIKKNEFIRNVAILCSGTAMAQAIPIAVSPVLSRIYTPEEFGLLALFVSCVSVLAVIATGRYEIAIMLPASHEDAANLVSFSLKLCVAASLLFYVPIVLFDHAIAAALGNVELAPWLYLLPLAVVATSVFNIFQFWCNRVSEYRKMSANRIQNAGLNAVFNVILGLGKVPGGMIYGAIAGQGLAALLIGRSVWSRHRDRFEATSKAREWALARQYKHHPSHIAPAQLIGVAAQQIPILLISHVFSLATAGHFSLAYRMVSLPTWLVANAIGDVYRQRIAQAYNTRGEFRDIFLATVAKTTLLAAPPFVVLYFISPYAFATVFGESWREAGEYARILVVSSFFQFVFTPTDKGALVVGATTYILAWHTARLLALAGLFLYASLGDPGIDRILWLFVLVNVCLYTIDGVAGYVYASRGKHG